MKEERDSTRGGIRMLQRPGNARLPLRLHSPKVHADHIRRPSTPVLVSTEAETLPFRLPITLPGAQAAV